MIVSSGRENDKVFVLHEEVGLCEEGRPALLALGRLRLILHNFLCQLECFFEFLKDYFDEKLRLFELTCFITVSVLRETLYVEF